MDSSLTHVWPIFVLAILTLCLFATASALRHTTRYSKIETSALEYVGDKLGRLREMGTSSEEVTKGAKVSNKKDTDTIPQRSNLGPVPLIPVGDLQEGLSKETIIADRLALIKRMRESQVKVSMSALQQMTLAKEASAKGLALPAFAASLSMMLGLLGTVVGLTLMVQQIDLGLPQDASQVTMDSWMASITQVRSVLGGMRIAFAATMAGITSAIVLAWLNHRLGRAQATFFDKLDRFTTEELLPATVPGSEDESLLEKITLQLDRSFARLDEVAVKNEETLQELSAIEKGFIEIVDTVKQTTKTETSGRIHELIGRLSGIIDHMAVLNKSVVTATSAMPEIIEQNEKTNQETLGRIDRLIEAYEQQRSLAHWPLQMKVVFGFMAALNFVLITVLILK